MPSFQSNGTRWNFTCRGQREKTQHLRDSTAVSHLRNHDPVVSGGGEELFNLCIPTQRRTSVCLWPTSWATLQISQKRTLIFFFTSCLHRGPFMKRCFLQKLPATRCVDCFEQRGSFLIFEERHCSQTF